MPSSLNLTQAQYKSILWLRLNAWPDPSIERTSPGKPGGASRLKRDPRNRRARQGLAGADPDVQNGHGRRHKLYSLRCTKKLLTRIGLEPGRETPAPTTLLGDWYANVLFAKPQHVVLCISERTLLPVVVPARQPGGLPQRLEAQLGPLLQVLGVRSEAIARELDQMREHRFASTASKSALGSLNDFMYHLSWHLKANPERSLAEHALQLSEIPCKPLEYAMPREATAALFHASSILSTASGV